MKTKTIYLVYSHEYNAGYVGKTGNVKERFKSHCGDKRSRVKQFCDVRHIKRVRDTFDLYGIIQCDKVEAPYYEGHIYYLIETHFQQITLINKNRPNRTQQESKKNWRQNNIERLRASNRNWYRNNTERTLQRTKRWIESHPGYLKQWNQKHPTYYKDYYHKKVKHRNKLI